MRAWRLARRAAAGRRGEMRRDESQPRLAITYEREMTRVCPFAFAFDAFVFGLTYPGVPSAPFAAAALAFSAAASYFSS